MAPRAGRGAPSRPAACRCGRSIAGAVVVTLVRPARLGARPRRVPRGRRARCSLAWPIVVLPTPTGLQNALGGPDQHARVRGAVPDAGRAASAAAWSPALALLGGGPRCSAPGPSGRLIGDRARGGGGRGRCSTPAPDLDGAPGTGRVAVVRLLALAPVAVVAVARVAAALRRRPTASSSCRTTSRRRCRSASSGTCRGSSSGSWSRGSWPTPPRRSASGGSSSERRPVLVAWLLGWADLVRRPHRVIADRGRSGSPCCSCRRSRRSPPRPSAGAASATSGARTDVAAAGAGRGRRSGSRCGSGGLVLAGVGRGGPGGRLDARAAARPATRRVSRHPARVASPARRSRVHAHGPAAARHPCYTAGRRAPRRARPARWRPHATAWTRSSTRSVTRSAGFFANPIVQLAIQASRLLRHPLARGGVLGVPRHAAAEREPDPARTSRPRSSSCSRRSCSCSGSSSTGSSGRRRRSARSTSATSPRRRSSPRSRRSRPARPAAGAINDEWIICPTLPHAAQPRVRELRPARRARLVACARGAARTSSGPTSPAYQPITGGLGDYGQLEAAAPTTAVASARRSRSARRAAARPPPAGGAPPGPSRSLDPGRRRRRRRRRRARAGARPRRPTPTPDPVAATPPRRRRRRRTRARHCSASRAGRSRRSTSSAGSGHRGRRACSSSGSWPSGTRRGAAGCSSAASWSSASGCRRRRVAGHRARAAGADLAYRGPVAGPRLPRGRSRSRRSPMVVVLAPLSALGLDAGRRPRRPSTSLLTDRSPTSASSGCSWSGPGALTLGRDGRRRPDAARGPRPAARARWSRCRCSS